MILTKQTAEIKCILSLDRISFDGIGTFLSSY
jgi:hypothetical protein